MTQKTIGRYEIRSELGKGGMGAVYLAYDPTLVREVALKLLPSYFAQDPEFSSRFAREAKTVAGLDHQAIVPIHDYGEDDTWPYFVMRYMRGGSLKQRLVSGPMALEEVNEIIKRIASALDKAHSEGVIHRDVKPANILFDGEGHSYLSDFGIVRLAESSENFTRTGSTLGTPAYMSPEQVRADLEIDRRSDVYSLGLVLFEALSGEAPYQDDSAFQVQTMHVSAPIPRLRERRPDLPAGIQQVIDKAMAKDRNARYQTVGELAAALQAVTQPAPAAKRSESSPAAVPKPDLQPKPTSFPEPTAPPAATKPAAEGKPSVIHQPTAAQPAPRQPVDVPARSGGRRKWVLALVVILTVLCFIAAAAMLLGLAPTMLVR